jgi:hypothetical protein
MTNPTPATATPATPVTPVMADAGRTVISKDIHAKWGKFSEADVAALKTKDELVTQVAAKYGMDKAIALRDVDALLKGRSF